MQPACQQIKNNPPSRCVPSLPMKTVASDGGAVTRVGSGIVAVTLHGRHPPTCQPVTALRQETPCTLSANTTEFAPATARFQQLSRARWPNGLAGEQIYTGRAL
jgi:hypothetical protein